MLTIRLQRTGRKKQPFFNIVVAEHSVSAKGKFIEKLGFYNPITKPWTFEIDANKAVEWVKKGARPSNTVARLLKSQGVKDMDKFIIEMTDRKKKKEEEEVKEVPKAEKPADTAEVSGDAVETAQEPSQEEKPEEVKEEVKEEVPAEEKPEEEESPADEEKKEEDK
ncbi:30S ribosomal protein S16 [Candidatus Peregrinibacteria bacterium]|nr:30S ribosomal protein S16 [Candidatus Peregrinibacteria bacterium]